MESAVLERAGSLSRRGTARTLGQVAAETLWPTRCAVCDAPGELLCAQCRDRLPFIDATRSCPTCGAPHGAIQCTECNDVMLEASGRRDFPYDAMACATVLDDGVHRLIVSYKDGGEERLADTIGSLIAAYAKPSWAEARPVVTYIPSSAKALARRGFDHAELASAAVARALRLPHAKLLDAPRTHDQRKLSRKERAENMAATFEVLPGIALPRACIVVDDVCTTGATLYSAADALAKAGVRKRFALTLARTLS